MTRANSQQVASRLRWLAHLLCVPMCVPPPPRTLSWNVNSTFFSLITHKEMVSWENILPKERQHKSEANRVLGTLSLPPAAIYLTCAATQESNVTWWGPGGTCPDSREPVRWSDGGWSSALRLPRGGHCLGSSWWWFPLDAPPSEP